MLAFALALQLAFQSAPMARPTEMATDTDTIPPRRFVPFAELIVPGSMEEERLRAGWSFAETGDPAASSPPGPALTLLRAPALVADGDGILRAGGVRVLLLSPRFRASWNSTLPFSLHGGTLWTGRGPSFDFLAGVAVIGDRWRLVLAPRIVHTANADFQTFSNPVSPDDRIFHPLSSPFHPPPASMDLPQRPGYRPVTEFRLGESSLSGEIGNVTVGVATESLWWGPGTRNGIVMSANASGIPHFFVRTAHPVRAGFGSIEARYILGRLTESEWFDFDEENDHRSLSALALTFTPDFEPELSVGFARAVYAPMERGEVPISSVFDVLRNVGRPTAAAPEDSAAAPSGPDQLFAFFGRWRFPAAGAEAYVEWGRREQPASLRDLLLLPGHSQGYTFGLRWARPIREAELRLHAEVTYLEPSASFRLRRVDDWYTSRSVPQGYTHRGEVIGAAIGPGGSSQWIAADLVDAAHGRWTAGAFLTRIRWENDAQFSRPGEFTSADVSLVGGVRAGWSLDFFRIDAELMSGLRYNYLFQAEQTGPGTHRGVDLRNRSLNLVASVRPGWSRRQRRGSCRRKVHPRTSLPRRRSGIVYRTEAR